MSENKKISKTNLKFNVDHLIPIVVQDKATQIVLMFAYARLEDINETVQTGYAVFYSRSRGKRWKKGEEKSGNTLIVHETRRNCNDDSLLYIVTQNKPEAGFCHTGASTCFFPVSNRTTESKRIETQV